MKIKQCKLVFVPSEKNEIKTGKFVEYSVYNLNRTVSKCIGRIETCIGKNFIKLGNGEFYNERDLKFLNPCIYSGNEVIADSSQFALVKDESRYPNSCAIPVPIGTIEINEILENEGICFIEVEESDEIDEFSGDTESNFIIQHDTPITINNKIIIVL